MVADGRRPYRDISMVIGKYGFCWCVTAPGRHIGLPLQFILVGDLDLISFTIFLQPPESPFSKGDLNGEDNNPLNPPFLRGT